jgi:uncharacterized membrane protein/glycosyltransferase involved in cell wall biosynthesis
MSVRSTAPRISVVVCSYNGADRIRATLQSLLKLDYPQAAYEILVIDDGSTDDTAKVVSRFKRVRLVSHPRNKGIAAARSTGMRAAAGKWVAFIDDDCTASRGWLRELETSFAERGVMAAGGHIRPKTTKTAAQRYLYAAGYGHPAPLATGAARGPWSRFKAYMQEKFTRQSPEDGPVYEVYGANSMFVRRKLMAVRGFNTELSTAEDSDICRRLHEAFPEQTITFNARAVVTHEYPASFAAYLVKLFRRQHDTFRYYRRQQKTAPVYPFPILILLATVACGWAVWWAPILTALALPPLLYAWWPLRAIRERRPEFVAYAYMQCTEEFTRLAGLLRASLLVDHMRWRVSMALAVAAVAGFLNSGLAHMLLALGAIVLPGYLLMLLIGLGARSSIAERAAGTMALGTLWLMGVGLVAAILPAVGIQRSLGTPAVVTYALMTAVLAVLVHRQKPTVAPLPRIPWNRDTIAVAIACGLLPFGAVVGARLLDAGTTNVVAIGTLIVGIATLLFGVVRSKHLPDGSLAAVLFAVSLAALWSYALRSSYLFGWDIQQEYAAFHATQVSGAWQLGAQHAPYDAMLSLTVFPALLAHLSGLSGVTIFKVVFPILCSLVPVVLYITYRHFANKWLSLVAGALFIGQFAYLQEFAALARQELGFLFFALLLFAIFVYRDAEASRGRSLLIVASMLGMIVSHYSTTYFAIALLGLAYVVAKGVGWLRHDRAKWAVRVRPPQFLQAWMLAALLLGAVVWYGPATHSSGLLSAPSKQQYYAQFIRDQWNGLVHPTQSQISAASATDAYLKTIGGQYHNGRQYMQYYQGVSNSGLRARAPQEIRGHAPWLGQLIAALDTVLRYAWWMLGATALALVAWQLWIHFDFRRLEIAALGLSAVAAFAAIHAFPAIGRYYNVARLNQQALMIVALPAVVLLAALLRRLPVLARKLVLSGAVALAFAIAAGLTAQLVGGTPTANLNNIGTDYQHYYITGADVAAAQWLDSVTRQGSIVYADRYANLRLVGNTDTHFPTFLDITPETIATDAYVYADRTNVVDGVTAAAYQDQVVQFDFPTTFLNQHKNVLYTNGTAEVYK